MSGTAKPYLHTHDEGEIRWMGTPQPVFLRPAPSLAVRSRSWKSGPPVV